MRHLVALLLGLLPLTCAADAVYRSVDAQGNVIFTDSPPADGSAADRIKIGPTNTVQATPPQPPPAAEAPEPEQAAVAQYTVSITEPPNETSFPMGPGNFSVRVSISPELDKYHGLQLFLDGTARGGPQRDTQWDLTNVFRGRHDVTVGVVDAKGKTLSLSAPVTVFVHRPSVNFNNRKNPPPKPPPKPK